MKTKFLTQKEQELDLKLSKTLEYLKKCIPFIERQNSFLYTEINKFLKENEKD